MALFQVAKQNYANARQKSESPNACYSPFNGISHAGHITGEVEGEWGGRGERGEGAGTSGEKAYLKVNSAATKHKEPSRGSPREHRTGGDY